MIVIGVQQINDSAVIRARPVIKAYRRTSVFKFERTVEPVLLLLGIKTSVSVIMVSVQHISSC